MLDKVLPIKLNIESVANARKNRQTLLDSLLKDNLGSAAAIADLPIRRRTQIIFGQNEQVITLPRFLWPKC